MPSNKYRFFAYLLFIQVALLCMHWFVYTTLILLLHIENPVLAAFLKYTLLFLAISFISASVLAMRYKNKIVTWFYAVASTWMGFFYFLFIASFFSWIAFDFFLRPSDAEIFTGLLLSLALVVSVRGVIKTRELTVTRISMRLPNLPQSWAGKTAVFISDIHAGHIYNRKFVNRLVEKINGINPDIVLIAGDFYDGLAVDLTAVTEPLSRLKTKHGVYFVTGNHEQFGNDAPYLNALKKAGVKVLDNEIADIDGLQLIGVDHASTEKRKDYEEILGKLGLEAGRPSILLRHVPDHIRLTEKAGISAQLSGHSHNGQVFPLDLISAAIYRKFHYGPRKYKNLSVYTSSGTSTWGPPLRVGTKSEMVVINFQNRA